MGVDAGAREGVRGALACMAGARAWRHCALRRAAGARKASRPHRGGRGRRRPIPCAPTAGGGGTPRHARAAAARHNAGRARPCHNGRRAAAAWASPAGTPQVRPRARRAARAGPAMCRPPRPALLTSGPAAWRERQGEPGTGTRATHARARGRTAPRRRPARMPAALRGGLAPAQQCPAAMAGGGGVPVALHRNPSGPFCQAAPLHGAHGAILAQGILPPPFLQRRLPPAAPLAAGRAARNSGPPLLPPFCQASAPVTCPAARNLRHLFPPFSRDCHSPPPLPGERRRLWPRRESLCGDCPAPPPCPPFCGDCPAPPQCPPLGAPCPGAAPPEAISGGPGTRGGGDFGAGSGQFWAQWL